MQEKPSNAHLITLNGDYERVVQTIPPIFCQRNTEMHAIALHKSGVLNTFLPEHALINIVLIDDEHELSYYRTKYLSRGIDALEEDLDNNKVFIVNGNTRNWLARTELYQWHEELRLSITWCKTKVDAVKVYESFDSKTSHKTSRDVNFSNLKIAGIDLSTTKLRGALNKVITTASSLLVFGETKSMSVAINSHAKIFKDKNLAQIESDLGAHQALVEFFKDELSILNDLKLNEKSHGVNADLLGAYLALLTKHRVNNQYVIEFIKGVNSNAGKADGDQYSGEKLLCDNLTKIKHKNIPASEKRHLIACRVFHCFDLWIKNKQDSCRRIYPYRSSEMAKITLEDKELATIFNVY